MRAFLSVLVFAFVVGSASVLTQGPKSAARFSLRIATTLQPPATPGQPLPAVKPWTGTWRNLVVGESHDLRVQMDRTVCYFVWGVDDFSPDASFGWRLVVTPTALGREHADVRLRWVRGVQDGKSTSAPVNETTVRLRPGDALTLDAGHLTTLPEPACRNAVVSFSVALEEVEPRRERVVATDLWLVHRDPDGREYTQQLNVRGRFHDTVPFYFDDIRVGRDVLDVHGTLRAKTTSDNAVVLEFTAMRRWSRGTEYPEVRVLGNGATTFTLRPDDVTSVVIPLVTEGLPLDGKASQHGRDPALLGHSLSIRLRSRQIR